MILSGPKACRGSTKDARTYASKMDERYPNRSSSRWDDLTFPAFLHSLATEVGNGLLIPNGIFSAV